MATPTRQRAKRQATTSSPSAREARSRDSAASASAPLARALAELYRASLETFVERRRELVKELRAAGEVGASRVVASVSKPSRTAWALNQVARADPQSIRGVFEARDVAAAAQTRGELAPLQAATRAYRERLTEVVRAARNALREAGVASTATQARADARRIGETLQAAHADEAARERLLAGRLARDLQTDDPFAGLEASTPLTGRVHPQGAHAALSISRTPAVRATDQRQLARQRAVDEQRAQERANAQEREKEKKRRTAIEAARKRVASLEVSARFARSAAEESRFAAQRAQADAERAKRAALHADELLKHARAELHALDR